MLRAVGRRRQAVRRKLCHSHALSGWRLSSAFPLSTVLPPTILAPALWHPAALHISKGSPVALSNLSATSREQNQKFGRHRLFALAAACSTLGLRIHGDPSVRTDKSYARDSSLGGNIEPA